MKNFKSVVLNCCVFFSIIIVVGVTVVGFYILLMFKVENFTGTLVCLIFLTVSLCRDLNNFEYEHWVSVGLTVNMTCCLFDC